MKIRTRAILGICAALALAAVFTQPAAAQTINMEQAVLMGLENNPSMQAVRYEALGAEDARKSARGDFGPSASMSYSYSHLDHKKPNRDALVVTSDPQYFTANFNIHQDIFTGWRILSTYEKAALSKDQSRAKVASTELSLTQSIQENYLGLLKARADVKSAQDSVTRLTEQLKVTKAFYDVGLKPRLDVLQAVADLASAKDTLLQAQNAVDTQIARLNTLLGLPLQAEPDYCGQLEYLPFSRSLDDCLADAVKTRPDLDIARKSVEIAAKDKTIAKSDFYPQLGADWDWTSKGSGADASGTHHANTEYSSWAASLTANWTLFEWGKTYYATKQADKRVKQLEMELANTRQEAQFEVKSNHLKIHEAAERISVARKALEEAREGYRMAVARYQAQVGTNTDVLDAQARVTRAEADLTQALADYQIALARIFVSMGQKNPGLTTD